MRIELQAASRRRRRRRPVRQVVLTRPAPPARSSRRGLRAGRRAAGPRLPLGRLLALLIVLAVAYVAFTLLRSLPAPSLAAQAAASASTTVPGAPPRLAWPTRGEAAVAIEGTGVIGLHGASAPTPIASVAKVMTAYVVLHDHSLGPGASGPTLTVTRAEVAAYTHDAAQGQSVLAVRLGERLTERQALEGLLLPSGNNVAALLAAWDAGSQAAFVGRMNASAHALGLRHTHYADASGVAAGTVSTAGDQLHLAQAAFALPALRRIVALRQVTLPVAGRQLNVDTLLGRDGIVGIKTGTTGQAGGCFVFAARVRRGGAVATVIGVVLHQPATASAPSLLDAAFAATQPLLASVSAGVRNVTALDRRTTLAVVRTPWGAAVPVRAARTVRAVAWGGLLVRVALHVVRPLPGSVAAGQSLGTATVTVGARRLTVPVLAAAALPGASLGWRLRHP